jgi:hypothetical protein
VSELVNSDSCPRPTTQELAAAVSSPDPREFVSHIAVHQDGSCNGLQHYAALGRDRRGAEQAQPLLHDASPPPTHNPPQLAPRVWLGLDDDMPLIPSAPPPVLSGAVAPEEKHAFA